MECRGTPTPQQGKKNQTSAHSARVCTFPLCQSTSHIKQQRTRALPFKIGTQGKVRSRPLNATKQHSPVSIHCFHCEQNQSVLDYLHTATSHVRLPWESGCVVDTTLAISTQHRGERSPETALTYHAAGRSQLLSVQRCMVHYPVEG